MLSIRVKYIIHGYKEFFIDIVSDILACSTINNKVSPNIHVAHERIKCEIFICGEG